MLDLYLHTYSMNNIPTTPKEWQYSYQRIKTPMIDLRGIDRKNHEERQKQCNEYTKKSGEFSVESLRSMWPIQKVVPSNNPEDRWIKKEWIIETHRAIEWHYTRIYKDPHTNKTMLLWQGDEDGWLVIEYDSDEHWKICDHYTFFRLTSEIPPRYYDKTHPNYSRSEKIRDNVAQHVFKIMQAFDPDFMKEFQIKK